jgi:hypothetical protein
LCERYSSMPTDLFHGGGHHAEEELNARVVHGHEANFIDQDDVSFHDLLDDPADGVVGQPAGEGHDETGGAEVAHPSSLLDGAVHSGCPGRSVKNGPGRLDRHGAIIDRPTIES